MDGYENMYKTVCRTCLSPKNGKRMFSLIDKSSEDGLSCYGKAIPIVTDVLVQKDDNLPTMMCQKCVHLLKQTIYFKLMCESSDNQFQRLINENVNSDTSDGNIEKIVCDYVMFNKYFPQTNTECLIENSDFIHKISQSSIAGTNTVDRTHDFDDYIDEQNFKTNNKKEQDDEYSNEINNILDAMQRYLNSDSKFSNTQFLNGKFKREHRYKPVPIKERNLQCEICQKVLANRLTYDHHMQRHENCKFICDQCGKGFPVLAEMQRHQIARHGVGPYLQCDHCHYKAPRKLDLIEHLRLHTGERPFTCDKCGLTFRRKAIWRNHLICHFDKQFQCTFCARKFYRHGDMLAHCNNVHERMYMYACSVCSVTYTKTATVRRHMFVKHGISREKQGKIGRVTSTCSEFSGKVA